MAVEVSSYKSEVKKCAFHEPTMLIAT